MLDCDRRGGCPQKQVEVVQGKQVFHPFDDLEGEVRERLEGVQEYVDKERLPGGRDVSKEKKW